MADKKQAIKWLLDGHKVTLHQWGGGYIYLNNNDDVVEETGRFLI